VLAFSFGRENPKPLSAAHTSSFQLACAGISFSGEGHSKNAVLLEESLTMRLADNLRKVEEKSVSTIRRGMERAREEWADVERRIRQRMRIYPQKACAMAAVASNQQFNLDRDMTDLIPNPALHAPLASPSTDGDLNEL
jgi:hypothetical protein